MKLEHFLTPYTKINSKWTKDPNVRPDTLKLSEENLGRTLYDVNHSKILFDPPPREMERKTKINIWDLMKKLLHSKGNHKQDKKTALRMGENICKLSNGQRINLQNIQAAQYQKTKQPNPKMGRRPK